MLLLVVVSGASIVDNEFGVLSFFLFPFVDVLRSDKPCIIVLQIITLSGFSFFIFHKVIQVVFPSFGWYSCSPLSLCRHDRSRIPLGGFSGPSVCVLGVDSHGLSPFQLLLCFNPTCDVVCQHFFISFFRASF